MKTIREKDESLPNCYEKEIHMQGYKEAIEGIFNDITNSQVMSVESIQKYLQDLMK